MKKYDQALERINFMLETIPKKYADQLWLIRGQIRAKLGSESEMQLSKSDMKRASKNDAENYTTFTEGRENVQIGVFPQSQRLCNSFAYIKTPLTNG